MSVVTERNYGLQKLQINKNCFAGDHIAHAEKYIYKKIKLHEKISAEKQVQLLIYLLQEGSDTDNMF